MHLHTVILEKIHTQGPLSFAEFMQYALYAPSGGYYTEGMACFGQDFTTAPEISPLFATCLAHQCAEVLSQI